MSMLLAALAGANMIYGLGMIDLGMTLDFGQLVIDNEIAKMVRQVLGGIPVNEDTLAMDVIRKVGAEGHFLMEEHTLNHMKTVQSQSKLFDRNTRQTWQAGGGKDLAARAAEEARYILENHKPTPLPESTGKKLREMIEEAKEEWKVKN
jgi:trimethylamine--corrinoid protein Co-methyltransferase